LAGSCKESNSCCEFWTKYTGIKFDIVSEINPNLPGIAIVAKFDQDPGIVAGVTSVGYKIVPYEIGSAVITLYKFWLSKDELGKTSTIIHELGHVILLSAIVNNAMQWHTNDGGIMDPDLGSKMLHTYQQLACKIIYNKNPGDNI
jgi:hypothetical protein